METDATWPHDEVLAGSAVVTVTNRLGYPEQALFKWGGLFTKADGRWDCAFAHDTGVVEEDELIGHGETVRQAFESLVWKWTMLNGGVESPALKTILPDLRSELDAHGFTR